MAAAAVATNQSLADKLRAEALARDPNSREKALSRLKSLTAAKAEDDSLFGTIDRAAGEFGAGFNRYLAATLGLPGDILTAINQIAPLPFVSENVIGPAAKFMGSESMVKGVTAAGLNAFPKPGPDAPLWRRTLTNVGEMLGASAIPAGGALGAAARTAVPALASATPLVRYAGQNAGRFGLGELGLSTAAGAGMTAGEVVAPDNPYAGMVGAVLGGGLGAAGGAAVRGARAAIKAGTHSLTKTGQERAAANYLRNSVSDIESTLKKLKAWREKKKIPQEELLTAAQVANDPGMLSLERAIVRSEAQLSGRLKDASSEINKLNQAELALMGPEGNVGAAQSFIRGRVQRLNTLIDERINLAVRIAKDKVGTLQARVPIKNKPDAAKAVREELEKALADARAEEHRIWGRVPAEEMFPTQPLRDIVDAIEAGQKKAASPADLPKDILTIIKPPAKKAGPRTVKPGEEIPLTEPEVGVQGGKFLDAESADELLALRSRIMAEKRAESANPAPNRRLLANLDALENGVLETLEAHAGNVGGPAGQAVRDALDYSRMLNDKFTRGPVGDILRFGSAGGKRVPDELTLNALFQQGEKGLTSAKSLAAAAGSRSGALVATRAYVVNRFLDETTINGVVDPKAASRFLKNHDAFISEFPDLKAQLSDIASAQKLAEMRLATGKRSTRAIEQSRAALFLNADPEKAINRVLSGPKPADNMREMMRLVADDQTGQAVAGLRRAFFDHMMSRISLAELDAYGSRFLGANKLGNFMKDNAAVLKVLYPKDTLDRMAKVANVLQQVERSNRPVLRGGSDTAVNINVLSEMIAKTVGAKIGALLGGTIQSAGFGARFARSVAAKIAPDQAQALVKEAIFDPAVMETLLMKATPQTEQIIVKRIRGHLAAIAAQEAEAGPAQSQQQ